MRVIDLDHDMSDVIPTGTSLDSEYLFKRMEQQTFAALRARRGARVLDSAAGIGQDGRALERSGLWVVGVEPSRRMTALARMEDEKVDSNAQGAVARIRAWSEALPFEGGSFDAVFCKGALDHFDDPALCIREMARVTRREGRVVLAVANFASLGCRVARVFDRFRRGGGGAGRRHFDVPSDHFTRYDSRLLREHAGRFIRITECVGVSLFWGVGQWASLVGSLPASWASFLLRSADAVARRLPALADVIVISGPPKRG